MLRHHTLHCKGTRRASTAWTTTQVLTNRTCFLVRMTTKSKFGTTKQKHVLLLLNRVCSKVVVKVAVVLLVTRPTCPLSRFTQSSQSLSQLPRTTRSAFGTRRRIVWRVLSTIVWKEHGLLPSPRTHKKLRLDSTRVPSC